MKEENKSIQVTTRSSIETRGRVPKEIKVDILGKNVNLFIAQIGSIIDNTPEKIDKFKLTQISVTAEISAKGSLVLLGTGVETEGKGGITFVFTKP